MKKKLELDKSKKKIPVIWMAVGIVLALALLVLRLNWMALVCVLYCCVSAAALLLSILSKKKVYAPMVFGFTAALAGVIVYYVIWGADAGFGAFSSGKAGFSTAANRLFCAEGNFFTRLLGNLLDNAIESCLKLGDPSERFIRLYIGTFKGQLYISITNATDEVVRKIDADYISHKRGNHGHGLKRIDQVVQKYQGVIRRQNEPGVFVTEIFLPI